MLFRSIPSATAPTSAISCMVAVWESAGRVGGSRESGNEWLRADEILLLWWSRSSGLLIRHILTVVKSPEAGSLDTMSIISDGTPRCQGDISYSEDGWEGKGMYILSSTTRDVDLAG